MKAFIPQFWSGSDAEVTIPVPPYAMAPVSEISRCVILRMLDAEVAATHPARGPAAAYGGETLKSMDFSRKRPAPEGEDGGRVRHAPSAFGEAHRLRA